MMGYIFCHLAIKSMCLRIIIEYIFFQFAKYLFPKDQQIYPKNGISLIIYINVQSYIKVLGLNTAYPEIRNELIAICRIQIMKVKLVLIRAYIN
jgi:hypothetical protein